MRKIEVSTASGEGKAIAEIANREGAEDSMVLKAGSPEGDKDVVTITVEKEKVDEIIEKIGNYSKEEGITTDTRIWNAEKPFTGIEETGEESEKVPFEELKAEAYQSTSITLTYMALCVLTAALATLGLLQGNVVVIIGAMVIFPILRPIMTVSIGTIAGDLILFLRGVAAVGVAVFLGAISAFLVNLIIPWPQLNPLIMSISQLDILTVAIALVAGFIAGVSMISEISEKLAGVAIAAALVPPIAALGINIFSFMVGRTGVDLIGSTALVIVVNCLAIDIGGGLVFYLSGLVKVTEKLFSTHIKVATLLLILFSVPFAYTSYISFQKSQLKNNIRSEVNENVALINGSLKEFNVDFDEAEVTLEVLSTQSPPSGFKQKIQRDILDATNREFRVRITYIKTEET